jgi:NADH dehydrogenase FAD-containing subunit
MSEAVPAAAAVPEVPAAQPDPAAASPTLKKQIVVVGGGPAGTATSHYLLKFLIPSLPEPSSYHVTMIDPSSQWIYRVAAPRSLISDKALPLSKWIIPFEQGFGTYPAEKFTLIQGTATSLDTSSRIVTIEKATKETITLNYYALVIATGARSQTPLYGAPYAHEVTVSAIETFRAKLPEAKSIVIAGGGPAGVETAAEIGQFLNGRAGLFSARPSTVKAKITLVTNTSKLLPVLRPALGKKAETLLNKVGVDVVYDAGVTSTVPENAGRLDATLGASDVIAPTKVTLSNGEVLEADLYIPAYGLTPNSSWLPKELVNEKGFLVTDPDTLRVTAAGQRVYGVGEIGSYKKQGGLFEFQLAAFPTFATNLKRDLLHEAKVVAAGGDEKSVPVTGKDSIFSKQTDPGESQLVPVGGKSGAGALFGWKIPGFLIWLIKGRQYLTEMNGKNISGGMLSEVKHKDGF